MPKQIVYSKKNAEENANRPRKRRLPTALKRIPVVVMIGTVLILLGASAARLLLIHRALSKCDEELAASNPVSALGMVERVEPWCAEHPAMAQQAGAAIVRCLVRMDLITEATQRADAIYNQATRATDDSDVTSTNGITLQVVLLTWPDRVVGMIMELVSGQHEWDPAAGYAVIIEEMERDRRIPELEYFVDKLLFMMPDHEAAKAAEDRIQRGEVGLEPPEPDGPTAVAPSPPEPDDRGELLEREQQLKAQLEKRTKVLKAARLKADPAYRKYSAAKRAYSDTATRAKQLQVEMDRATGGRRMDILDELRNMKGQMSKQKAVMDQAKTELQRAASRLSTSFDADPEVAAIKRELEEVRRKLRGQ